MNSWSIKENVNGAVSNKSKTANSKKLYKISLYLKKMESVGYITNYFSYNKMFKKMF